MGDAGGERADDFHFLRLEQLVLQLLIAGLVGDVADETAHLAGVNPGRDFHEPVVAVRRLEPAVLRQAGLEDGIKHFPQFPPARGVGDIFQQGAPDFRRPVQPETAVLGGQLPPAVVGVRHAEFAVEAVNGAVERMQDAADKIVLQPEIALQFFARGDVALAGHITDEPAHHVGNRRDGGLDLVKRAVAADVGQFADPFASLADVLQIGADLFRLGRRAQEFVRAVQHGFDAVAGDGVKGGIDKGDAEIGVRQEKNIRRGVNGGDQAVDVRFQPHPAGDILEGDERVVVVQRHQFQVRHATLPAAGHDEDGMQRVGTGMSMAEHLAQFLAGGRQQDIENGKVSFGRRAVELEQALGLGIDFHHQSIRTADDLRILGGFKEAVPPLIQAGTRQSPAPVRLLWNDRRCQHGFSNTPPATGQSAESGRG